MNPLSFKLSSHKATRTIVVIVSLLFSSHCFAQLGPGGVSHETPNTLSPTQSDVRLWLDAGSLTGLADGDDVSVWDDISFSNVNDKGFRQSSDNFLPPYFRDDPSASINGYPVVTFENGRMLKVNTSSDLNSSNSVVTTYEQTIILAFRTSEDVNSRQILWEEGGGWRGMNIFIFNGEIYLGAYDNHVDPDIGWGVHGKVPAFGYNYVKSPVQPNTTYVISHVFDAPTDNSLNGSIKGYRNGSFFGTLINGGQENGGIGGIYKHPDAIGIGAVNSDTYNETGPKGNITGQQAFKGRLAEICYYNRLLNDAERIIVENYLGAKYYANIIVNDKYEYQSGYGTGVVGIGQTLNNANYRHTVCQGTNPFEVSAVNESVSFNLSNEFLLFGHNRQSMNLTDLNVPNDSGSTRRTERIWRFDESQNLSTVKFRFHSSQLLPLSAGYTKHVLIFDDHSANTPNFSTENATVVELTDVGGGFYEATKDIVDGAFMTLGILKPQASFSLPENFALESDPSPDSTLFMTKVYARLNYTPLSPVRIDFSFTDLTATRADDYGYLSTDVANGILFPTGVQEVPIRIWVKNDVIQENPSTESFAINLEIGSNTTAGLGIGSQSQHIFTIYDNDPPPKLSFAQAASAALENAGSIDLDIVRTGSTIGSASARIRVLSGPSTATANEDYTFPAYKTVSFSNGEGVKSVSVDIQPDLLDENDETIRFQLYYISGAGSDASSILEHTLTIVDDDLPPTVEFTSAESQSYETNGTPSILIELDKPSSKEVLITYTKTENLATAATFGPDYSLAFPATIVIAPGDTLGYPSNFVVQQDGVSEPDETVEFELTASTNATLGTGTSHVYTIKDYSTFEWKGVAGIGKPGDNIYWFDLDKQSGSHNSTLQNITNFSPHNINVSQSNNNFRGRLQVTANTINGRKTLKFDGTNDNYVMANSGLVNTAPNVQNKGYFFVMRTGPDVAGWQTIYKQGGGSRGLAIYIKDGSLYFNAWNNPNDGPESNWGSGTGSGQDKYARYDGLQANTNYIVSCLFDKDNPERIRIYVNGQLGQRVETGTCGLIYSHSGSISIGGTDGSALYHDGSNASGRYFKGYLAEMIHFSDAPISEVRRQILENYYEGKYEIPLINDQLNNLTNGFSHEIAGIGRLNNSAGETHIDSQGPLSILRIKSPTVLNNSSYLIWGHNNVPLEEIWPWSGGSLPSGVVERSGRVWSVGKTGNINGVELLLRYQALQNAASLGVNDLKLLIHNNSDSQDFSNATVINASEIMSGNVAKFTSVNFNDGDFFALANSSTITPLPIELLNFNAKYNGADVLIDWSTASELNNEKFIIERAGDDLRFEPIITQPGAGNSNTILFYIDIDENPLNGLSYYRLKQVDYDGSFEYSDPVSVYIELDNSDVAFNIFPNPNQNRVLNIFMEGQNQTRENIKIDIVDMTGKKMFDTTMSPEIQSNTIQLPERMTAGIYLVHFSNKELDKTYKLVISN